MKKFDNLIDSIYECLIYLLGICLLSFGIFGVINNAENPTSGIVVLVVFIIIVFLIMGLILLIFVLIFGFRYYIINDNEIIRKKTFHKKIIIKFDEITAIEKGKSYVNGYMNTEAFDKYDTYFVYNSSGKKIDLIDDANLKEVLSKNDAFNEVFKKFTCVENDKQ